jgi:hypothetical protein
MYARAWHLLLLMGALALPLRAQTPSTISYQGYLEASGAPANGSFDFRFQLYNAASGGAQVGPTVALNAVTVTDGVFNVAPDFGNVAGTIWDGARWLRTEVRPAGGASYVELAPRTPLTASPYALGLSLPMDATDSYGGPLLFVKNTLTVGAPSAIRGESEAATGIGIAGAATATSGDAKGVYGTTVSPTGVGVYGRNTASAALGSGVLGESTLGSGYGVHGKTSGTGTGLGHSAAVRAQATATTDNAYGIFATSASSGAATIYAYNTASGGFAGYFADRVRVNDALNIHNGTATSPTLLLDADEGNNASAIKLRRGTTTVIELDAEHNGAARIFTEELEITGGSDLSENFDVAPAFGVEAPLPGMVVSIDPGEPGRLRLSGTAYDPLVAGIVSGAGGVETGLIMGQRGSVADGDHAIALVGRVYVLVDAAYGAVRPGDLLTTSETPGHAMRAADRERAHGAILGKAMTGLDSGRGLVLVLVTLQ